MYKRRRCFHGNLLRCAYGKQKRLHKHKQMENSVTIQESKPPAT